jgi:CubicO group peptidase (beta-lactamase class C family)
VPSTKSFFDLASLAKPFTATLALVLEARGELRLCTLLGDVWPEVASPLAQTPLEDLLRHRSRLQPWTPLYGRLSGPGEVARLLLNDERLVGARRPTYSDLGFILWGLTVEQALGENLEELLRELVLKPLDIHGEISGSIDSHRAPVECHLDNSRERALAGGLGFEVEEGEPPGKGPQDGNARWLGRYLGHAGLFGSARALWGLAVEWLEPQILSPILVADALEGRGRFRLGWWRATASGSAGRSMSKQSFGHVGFSGGSLWIDPESRLIFVLLAHRKRTSVDLTPWRRRFHAIGTNYQRDSW